jgi:hypothetical protein
VAFITVPIESTCQLLALLEKGHPSILSSNGVIDESVVVAFQGAKPASLLSDLCEAKLQPIV